jgi:hypothetical protein
LAGSRDLTLEQGQLVAEFFGLASLETDYFILLLQIERAGTTKLKEYWGAKLAEVKKSSLQVEKRVHKDRILTDYEKSIFYSSWLYSAVRAYSSIGEGQTFDSMVQKFNVPRTKLTEIIQFLVNSGLCVEENGLIKAGPQRTHLELSSPFISKHHGNWRNKAIQKTESLSSEELMYTAPLSISKKDFLSFREECIALVKLLHERVKKTSPEEIACFNLDLYWIET